MWTVGWHVITDSMHYDRQYAATEMKIWGNISADCLVLTAYC